MSGTVVIHFSANGNIVHADDCHYVFRHDRRHRAFHRMAASTLISTGIEFRICKQCYDRVAHTVEHHRVFRLDQRKLEEAFNVAIKRKSLPCYVQA